MTLHTQLCSILFSQVRSPTTPNYSSVTTFTLQILKIKNHQMTFKLEFLLQTCIYVFKIKKFK